MKCDEQDRVEMADSVAENGERFLVERDGEPARREPRRGSVTRIRLPSDSTSELPALVERLAGLAPGTKIDWSDSWSEEDLREFRAASLRRLDATESEDMD